MIDSRFRTEATWNRRDCCAENGRPLRLLKLTQRDELVDNR
jgi:hypothetical protein